MPSELEDLVGFIDHGNTPIRQAAIEHLVPYSLSQPAIFKVHQLLPVRQLKMLILDYEEIAKNAITILINLSRDSEVSKELATDDKFLDLILTRLMLPTEPNPTLLSMLLSNLAKHPSLTRLHTTSRPPPSPSISSSPLALTQLLDLFVRGVSSPPPKSATSNSAPKSEPSSKPESKPESSSSAYDYLSYLFADLAASTPAIRTYFLTPQPPDSLLPLSKILPFTTHPSPIRRAGVASAIKNVAFDVSSHTVLFGALSVPIDPPAPAAGGTGGEEAKKEEVDSRINILPFLLSPLISGRDNYTLDETLLLPDELQFPSEDKKRDSDLNIIKTHTETILLLGTTREGREVLREGGVYAVVREVHLGVDEGIERGKEEEEEVREVCERVVQVLMRGEEGEEVENEQGMKALQRKGNKAVNGNERKEVAGSWAKVEEVDDDDDDDRIEDV